jgi:UDP-N-acetyl-2-amino-2-deoxyglucuronate dehydrogenase
MNGKKLDCLSNRLRAVHRNNSSPCCKNWQNVFCEIKENGLAEHSACRVWILHGKQAHALLSRKLFFLSHQPVPHRYANDRYCIAISPITLVHEVFMPAVRTALIGCGKVGQIHAAALRNLPESLFVAVCDHDATRAAAFADRFGTQPYTDVGVMLRDAKPQAVCICPLHAAGVIQAAAAGAAALVEKPLAANLADCDAMLTAARKAGTKLGVISQRRLYEPVLRIKAAIDAGKIGRPVLGVFTMFSWRDQAYYQSDPWRGKWSTEGGGVLVNQSPHHLDLLQWFMGDVEEITGCWANLNHSYIEVEDTALAMVRFKNGGLGSIVTSLSQKPGIHSKIHIHGFNGASVGVETDRGATFVAGMSEIAEPPLNDVWTIPGEEGLLAGFQAEDRARFAQVNATTHYHALQIQDFLQAVRDDRPPLVTGEEGRTVVEMFTAIYRSNRERRPIQFPLDAEG